MPIFKKLIPKLLIFILLIVIGIFNGFAINLKGHQKSNNKNESLDSLENNLILYFDRLQSYDQVIAFFKEKKALDNRQLTIFNQAQKNKEHTKFQLDSLKLIIAEQYYSSEIYDKAESLFNELIKSDYTIVRNKAAVNLKILLQKKKPEFYEKYPFKTLTDIIKPILIYIILLMILMGFSFFYNRGKNKRFLAVICNDNEEITAFKFALKIMLDQIQAHSSSNSRGTTIVAPGPFITLPHLEPEVPSKLTDFMTATLPEGYLKILSIFWNIGINPQNILSIIIEKYDDKVTIKSNLKIRKAIVYEWNKTIDKNLLFETRMDISYETLIKIQFFLLN